jgi:hypothetical protein
MTAALAHVGLYLGSVGATLLFIGLATLAAAWVIAKYRRALGGWK